MSIVKILAILMIAPTMFAAGLQVDRQRLVQTLRQYGLLGKAMLGNFVVLPLFALLVVRYTHMQGDVATGIVLMSMAPGVPFLVNSAGRKGGGSLSFALTIAFVFAAFSVITIPVTIWLISLALPNAPVPPVPGVKFITTLLVAQLAPLVAGALIGPRLRPASAEKLIRLLHFVFLGAAIVLLVLVFPKVASAVTSVYGSGRLSVIALIGLFAIGLGWLLGGPDLRYRRTLAIGTLMRNIGSVRAHWIGFNLQGHARSADDRDVFHRVFRTESTSSRVLQADRRSAGARKPIKVVA